MTLTMSWSKSVFILSLLLAADSAADAATSVSNHEGISEHNRELVEGCDSLGADECCDLGRLASVKPLMSMEQPIAATIYARLTQVLFFCLRRLALKTGVSLNLSPSGLAIKNLPMLYAHSHRSNPRSAEPKYDE
jgi:hypothetical protein